MKHEPVAIWHMVHRNLQFFDLRQLCVRFVNFRVVKKLISHNIVNGIRSPPRKLTPMHLACQNNQVEVVKTIATMVPQWVNSSDEDKDMQTPLHIASERGYVKIINVLVNHNAKLHPARNGATPIHLGVQKGNIEVVENLLSAYHDQYAVNIADNKGQTPLHYAARYCGDHPELVTTLIER